MLYATSDLEGVSGASLRIGWQRPDRQVSVEVFEDLQPRSLCVVAQQFVEMCEARADSAGRGAREIQPRLMLELSELEAESLEPGFDRLKLGPH